MDKATSDRARNVRPHHREATIWPVAAAVLGVVAFRAWLASLVPLTGDEGFGWLCSRHLAWSYDHPPLNAWITAALVTAVGEPLWGLRVGATLLTTLTLAVLFALARAITPTQGDARFAWHAVLVYLLVPYTLLVALVPTPELPLILFYLGASLAFVRFLQTSRARFAWLAGVCVGFGLLSKHTMVLFPVAVAVFFACNPDQRRLARRPVLWLAAVLAVAMFVPVVVADLREGAPSLAFHAQRLGAERWFAWTLAFAGDQLLYLSPVVGYLAARCLRRQFARPRPPAQRFLAVAALTPFLFFLTLSVKTHVWPHWTAVAFAPFALLASLELAGMTRRQQHAGVALLGAFDLAVAGYLLLWFPGVLWQQRAYRHNDALADQARDLARRVGPTRFASDALAGVAQVSYYAQVDAVMPTGVLSDGSRPFGWSQFDRWNIVPMRRGENLVVYTEPGSALHEAVRRHFETVRELPGWRLTTLEGYAAGKRFFLAEGFKLERAKI